ncbi:histidine kinase [Caulobacter henricii]|uniref:histidine kinase n=2 Tax=Caulobacter henricii TaxID=69395 RepID=A0A0P0P121_9CAUL|nr:response regulator [Caulobacter henricii]ALL14203.1 histidine kinase [Caulobacter henricii]
MDTHRLLLPRVILAALTATVIGGALGLSFALTWLSALLACEGLARLVTRRFSPGVPGSFALRAGFVLAALPINITWAWLAATLWLSTTADLKLTAVAIWAGQIVYTQNFRHQPWTLIAVSGVAPLTSLILFPFFFYGAQGTGPDTARWGLLIVALSTINTMIANRAAARRMDELTHRLREERERALEATRAKSTFIAVTSHELRTPMNGLLGMAHALSRSDLNETQREQVGLMIRSGDSLMQLLNDVLDLSRIEAGKVELVPEPFNLEDAVHDILNAWRDVAVLKNIKLTTRFDPEVPTWILGDVLRVRQVLTNLISNALKFTVTGGVDLQVYSPRPAVDGQHAIFFAVRDTGPGVPPEAAGRVFESFTQADDTISRSHGGAGLGLTISRALARQMGGDLTLAPSESGACFVLSIRAPGAEPQMPADLVRGSEPCMTSVRILMAEDNTINQLVVRAMLEATGLSLTVVDNGQQALEAMARGGFDCVLMDINMPVMDGITALQAIRSGTAGDPNLPVIALTASTMAGDRERFLNLGFSDHLGKPVKPAALIQAIERAISPDGSGRNALHDAA